MTIITPARFPNKSENSKLLLGTKYCKTSSATDKNIKWPEQPSWYQKPSDINNIFKAMIKNGINEKIAIKILGMNWLNFMKNHF